MIYKVSCSQCYVKFVFDSIVSNALFQSTLKKVVFSSAQQNCLISHNFCSIAGNIPHIALNSQLDCMYKKSGNKHIKNIVCENN